MIERPCAIARVPILHSVYVQPCVLSMDGSFAMQARQHAHDAILGLDRGGERIALESRTGTPGMGRPRVLLADDHALLLGAFEKLLTPECEIVGQVSDGRALITAAQQLKPDVIVVDIGMPHLNGLEAGRKIKQRAFRCRTWRCRARP